MSETTVRVAVILAILLLGGLAAVTANRSKRARPVHTPRDDLPPGVHLFSSGTCRTCSEARSVVASAYGDSFTEIRFEDDSQSFGRHRIARVPTTIVVLPDRTAVVFEGVPRRRNLVGIGPVLTPPS
jgi:hypothetical protein